MERKKPATLEHKGDLPPLLRRFSLASDSVLINAVTVHVGTGRDFSGLATRELTSQSVPDDRQSSDSFWKIHAAQEVLEVWVGTQVVNPEVGLQEIGKVARSFLVALF